MSKKPSNNIHPQEEEDAASFSSESTLSDPTPRDPVSASEILRVAYYENQRWFPVVGWGSSRLPEDPPVFTEVHGSASRGTFIAPAPSTSSGGDRLAALSVPLDAYPPSGYVWGGYWEVHHHHEHGTDERGWRYAEAFSGGRFRCTQTPACVVRRRVWSRVVLKAPSGPTASSSPSGVVRDTSGRAYGEDGEAVEVYLHNKRDEQVLVEQLKARRRRVMEAGGQWSTEDELAAEEELRTFVRDRRTHTRGSASRRLSANNSFANPFHPSPSLTVEPLSGGGTADDVAGESDDEQRTASTPWAADSPSNHVAVVSTSAPTAEDVSDGTALTFQHHEPSPRDAHVDALDPVPVPSVSHFVPAASSPDGANEPVDSAAQSLDADTNDFDAIFSKFVNNPELSAGAA